MPSHARGSLHRESAQRVPPACARFWAHGVPARVDIIGEDTRLLVWGHVELCSCVRSRCSPRGLAEGSTLKCIGGDVGWGKAWPSGGPSVPLPAPQWGEDQAHPPALHRLHLSGLGLCPLLLLPGTQHLAGE